MAKDILKDLSKKILAEEEDRYSNNSRIYNLSKVYGNDEEINKILIMGLNPAGYNNDYDEKFIGFIPDLDEEDYKKIKIKLKEEYKNYFNINYFKANYNLFSGNANMTWGINNSNRKKLSKELKEKLIDEELVKRIINGINDLNENVKDILIFVDLVYYHQTDSRKIKESLTKRYKKDSNDLKTNIRNIIAEQINMFKPSLIIITNAFVSDLLYGLFAGDNEIMELKNVNKETIKKDVIEIENVPIIFAGMVSREMDKYSYFRIKKRIEEVYKETVQNNKIK